MMLALRYSDLFCRGGFLPWFTASCMDAALAMSPLDDTTSDDWINPHRVLKRLQALTAKA